MRTRHLIFVLFFLPSIVQAQDPAPLRVAVAANFINIIETVATTYTARFTTPVQPTYGSTGKLYAQIHNGAPYDLFLAADHRRPQLLYEEGICEKPSVYAFGSVVLWSWDTEGVKGDNWQEILKSHSGKIAIANPATAPYGTKAMAAARQAGMETSIPPRLVYGQSAGQAFVFVQTKNTRFAFIALSHALSEQGRKGIYWPIPEAESIDQWGCVIKQSNNRAAAQQLLSFFTSDDGKEAFHNLGYRQ